MASNAETRGQQVSWRRSPTIPSIMLDWAGPMVGLGALFMFAKGALLITTGVDRSFVPWVALFWTLGLLFFAIGLRPSATAWRRALYVATAVAAIGVIGALVAVGYLVIRSTIPESSEAPAAVSIAYGVMSAGGFLGLAILGLVIVRNRSLAGRWRWVPLSAIIVQFPIFIVAGELGAVLDREAVADGLSMVLTGCTWLVVGFALSVPARRRPRSNTEQRGLTRLTGGLLCEDGGPTVSTRPPASLAFDRPINVGHMWSRPPDRRPGLTKKPQATLITLKRDPKPP